METLVFRDLLGCCCLGFPKLGARNRVQERQCSSASHLSGEGHHRLRSTMLLACFDLLFF